MKLSHINKDGYAKMVDVSGKDETFRTAVAEAEIIMGNNVKDMIEKGEIKKGNVLSVAQVAGIMAAKRTFDIIPMCHNINLTGVDIRFEFTEKGIKITSFVNTFGKTGAEMEALTAVSAAALTIYDMCKSVEKRMEITNIRLIEKTGGKSGNFKY